MKTLNNMPKTYNRKTWDTEIEGLRWYVEWKENDIEVTTIGRHRKLEGMVRLNYFTTQKAAYEFIDQLRGESVYAWYKEPGWEEEI